MGIDWMRNKKKETINKPTIMNNAVLIKSPLPNDTGFLDLSSAGIPG